MKSQLSINYFRT